MKYVPIAILIVLSLSACDTQKRSPDAIREDAAQATREVTQDAKAVAQGIAEGVKDKGPVNVNKASADDLKALPGIDDAAAHRIIDNRPYNDSYDLVKKRVVSKQEYDQIAGKVTAAR